MKVLRSAGLLCLTVGLAASSPGTAAAREQCAICHPESRVAYETSVHAGEEVSCADCHGGDPATRDADAAHRGRFRSLGDRLRVSGHCAECHADLGRMRAYNLPVDQYAVYQTSQHGRAVAAGEGRAAVCTDCHGSHDVRAPDEPASSVHPRNLPTTCGRCHSDEGLMGEFDLDPGVVAEYRSSVHGRSLLERGNAAAPNCTSCHGVHGATPPGVGDVDKVCGSCHVQTRRAFLAGPHDQAMRDAGLPECESCHSNHAIRLFEAAEIEALCTDCHGEGSDQARLGQKLYALIGSAADEVDSAESLALLAQQRALHVEDHLSRVEEARTYLTEALPMVHAVALEPVEEFTRRARSIGEEVQHEIYAKLDRRPAHIGLAVFWFYLLMTLAVLVAHKSRLAARQRR